MPSHTALAHGPEQSLRGPGRPSDRHFVSDGRRPAVGGPSTIYYLFRFSNLVLRVQVERSKTEMKSAYIVFGRHRGRHCSGADIACGGGELFCELFGGVHAAVGFTRLRVRAGSQATSDYG